MRNQLIRQFIYINVSVDVEGLPDGVVARRVESNLTTRIFEALKKKENRDALKKVVTRWLLGDAFQVVGVSSDNQALSIDYLLPLGRLEPFPEEPQPPLDPGLLANIDHIVVLMMENRSFDHMLGYLSKDSGRADVDGLRGGEKNRYKGRDYLSLPLPETVFNESPCHRHDCIEHQINGGQLDGFVADFAKHYESQGVDPGRVMGYYQAAHVSVHDALAKAFLICQRWFAAHPGPTFPNRFYTLTGRLNRDAYGLPEKDNPHDDAFKPVFTRTIFDHLTEHGVSWRYYEHRYCFLRMFERYTFDDNYYIVDARLDSANLVADIAAGRLPSVTFIDPNFIDEPDGQDNDDAPPANIGRGQRLIGQVVNAVMNSPKWSKTLLVITYDEHGGFYDHVNPLLFSEKAKPVSGINYYGVRVPTFVVSPWVDQGVSSDVFDHTSIAKTIARRFMSANPPDMGERVAVANDLSMVLRSTARQDRPIIPVPPEPVRNAALARQAAPVEASDDFKELLRTMRSRYPVPRAISSSAPLR